MSSYRPDSRPLPDFATGEDEPLLGPDWLIETKFAPPAVNVRLVHREAPLAALAACATSRLTILVAPAGFGKTTLLTQWLAAIRPRRPVVGWISLDEEDSDPARLLSLIVGALHRGGMDLGTLEQAANHGFAETPVLNASARLVAALGGEPRPIHLILDDYHRAASSGCDALLSRLLAHAPANVHVILSSRERPALAVSALKARGLVHDVDMETLRFDLAAATDLFGADTPIDLLSALVARSEGWGVALQLARLWMEAQPARRTTPLDFFEQSQDLAEYFTEQIFADLDADVQEVLLATAICDRLTPDLANALTGRRDADDILRRLARLRALFVPLDEPGTWMRGHMLLQSHLQTMLARRAPERVRELHRIASAWFWRQGARVDAVRHARLAGDFDRVATLIEACGGWQMVLFGDIATLRALMRELPHDAVVRYPTLTYAQFYLHLKDGDVTRARDLFDDARPTLEAATADNARLRRDYVLMHSLTEGYGDRWDSRQEIDFLIEGRRSITAEDILGLGCIDESIAVASLRFGDLRMAEQYATLALDEMREAQCILGRNFALFHLTQIQLLDGRLPEAEATAREVLAIALENFGPDSGQNAIGSALLAAALYMHNAPEQATALLASALPVLETTDSWFDILAWAYETQALATYALHGAAAAISAIERGLAVARDRELGNLHALIDACRLRIIGRNVEPALADRSMREAETAYPPGCWRDQPGRWRPIHQVGHALIQYYMRAGRLDDAATRLDDLIALARATGHAMHLNELTAIAAALAVRRQQPDLAASHILDLLSKLPDGYVLRTILDAGPAAQQAVAIALQRERAQGRSSLLKQRLEMLLAADGGRTAGDSGPHFSLREQQVLAELAKGQSNKQIARALDMTENTVKFHLKKIFAKLGTERRGQVIAWAQNTQRQGGYPNG